MQTKNRRCTVCRKKVDSDKAIIGGLRAFCSFEHLKEYQNSDNGKAFIAKARAKAKKERHAQLMEHVKTRGEWVREAQAAVNAFVRFRDRKAGCISCGRKPDERYGGSYDAGHYLSRGAHGNLRFNTFNIHKQCVYCNRYQSGAVAEYRINLIKKIGLERVERLEQDTGYRKMDVSYLKRIKQIFTKRLRIYQRIDKQKCLQGKQ